MRLRSIEVMKSWKLLSPRGWKFLAFLAIMVSIGSMGACKKDKTLDEDPSSKDQAAFDRKAMLKNYGENLIIPGYETLKGSVKDLESAASSFVSAPSKTKLQDLQARFREGYADWQAVSVYEFGPAKDLALRSFSNTFPTDTAKIEDNIATGNYDLSDFDTEAEKGFPALDYLLFDPYNGDTAVVNAFGSQARQDYLMDVIADLKGNVTQTLQEWKPSGGDHLSSFVSATGTDVGSSLGLMVNQLNYDLEIIKNAEIGIPLGKKSLGNPKPKNCQAYYSERSVSLAKTHLKALRDCYLGKGSAGDLRGLDDHLSHIDAQSSNGPLDKAIRDQFAKTLDQIEKIPEPLSQAVVNDPSPVDQAYTELKKLVTLLKTDMPSELGVQITYQDNDGD